MGEAPAGVRQWTAPGFDDIEDTLGKALDLLADCERAYRDAPGHLRHQWNQAPVERLVVYDERIADAEVAEPFATLTEEVGATFADRGGKSRTKSRRGAPAVNAATQPGRLFWPWFE